jgi:hypothetical protein
VTSVAREPGPLPGRLSLVYGPWIAILVTALTIAGLVAASLLAAGPGVRVTASSQPRLVELVESVARGLGHEPPARIRLIAEAEVREGAAGGRRELPGRGAAPVGPLERRRLLIP